jgi:voltage-gated potassium channel
VIGRPTPGEGAPVRQKEDAMGAGTIRGSDFKGTTHVMPGMTEEQAARARRLDAPTVVVVLLVVPALVLHFSEPQGTLGIVSDVLNWTIYGWFLFEFVYMLYLAPDNREYFRHNKLDLTVLLLTVPLLPGIFQALWVLRLLRLIDMLPLLLGRFVNITLLPYAVVLAFIGVFGGGLAFSHFENVSVFDGIYWANTTINTVGYGDVSAQTPWGKVLSMALQWTGNVILAMLIGGVAAFAQQLLLGEGVEEIEEDVEEVEEDVESLLESVRGLSATDRLILQELSRIRGRLDEVHPHSSQP